MWVTQFLYIIRYCKMGGFLYSLVILQTYERSSSVKYIHRAWKLVLLNPPGHRTYKTLPEVCFLILSLRRFTYFVSYALFWMFFSKVYLRGFWARINKRKYIVGRYVSITCGNSRFSVCISGKKRNLVKVGNFSKRCFHVKSDSIRSAKTACKAEANIKPDTPINVYTRFCLNTAKSKFSLVSPVADWWKQQTSNWIE